MLKAALAGTKDDYTTAEEVSDWMLYFRELEQLVEATFELARQKAQAAP